MSAAKLSRLLLLLLPRPELWPSLWPNEGLIVLAFGAVGEEHSFESKTRDESANSGCIVI